ncbi:MAG TPA: T9SS type A sorting domain-containing protein, partial [Candidatus Cloacimonadota bacterium]|nr:T9SS type A sorting domain-containing protein [Candidatus Cloacimonadota bacterium]
EWNGTAIQEEEITPESPAVSHLTNYPNPFNPSTTIQFETTNLHEFAQIEIYNIKGQKIRTLPVSSSPSRKVSVVWDGTDDNNKPVSSGIYFYKLKTGKIEKTKKCLLMK